MKVTFRQLLEDLSTIEAVAAHLDQQMPPEKVDVAPAVPGTTDISTCFRAAVDTAANSGEPDTGPRTAGNCFARIS